jgi:valyl-tRNA synthetase
MRLVYGFAWNQFADWYIEIAKAAPSPATPHVLREVFCGILKLLHPVMPFATEEMARVLGEDELLVRRGFPEYDASLEDDEADRMLDRTKRAISAVRSFRAESRVEGELEGRVSGEVDLEVFGALAGVRPVESLDESAKATLAAGDVVVEISLTEELRRGEIERLRREISRVKDEVQRAHGKLSNEKFVERAPTEVVSGEREKLSANTRVLETLTQRLKEYL